MRFITATLCAVGAFAAVVLAQQNPITKPDGQDAIVAGQPFLVQWKPTTEGTITLTLRQGISTNLDDVEVITADIPNSGSYEWTPSAQLPAADNYAIMITDSNGEVNYTPLLRIQSDVKSSAKPSSTTTTTEKSSSHSVTLSTKTSSSHSAHVTSASNSTVTTSAAMNSTRFTNTTVHTVKPTKSKTTTLEATATDDDTSASETADASAAPDSGAVTVRSPLALVACLVGAFVYFN